MKTCNLLALAKVIDPEVVDLEGPALDHILPFVNDLLQIPGAPVEEMILETIGEMAAGMREETT